MVSEEGDDAVHGPDGRKEGDEEKPVKIKGCQRAERIAVRWRWRGRGSRFITTANPRVGHDRAEWAIDLRASRSRPSRHLRVFCSEVS